MTCGMLNLGVYIIKQCISTMAYWFLSFLFLASLCRGQAQAPPQPQINITILSDAVKEGAVCLDGSPPAYYLRRGATSNWLLFMQGGGTCYGDSEGRSCLSRSTTNLGSSTRLPRNFTWNSGSASISKEDNPDFWNWTHVYITYCDGGCFVGDAEEPVPVSTKNGTRYIYYRGLRIWKYIMKDLLQKGMKDADTVLLSGCSAGATATALLCNDLQDLIPQSTIKCSMDGGLFIDVPDLNGTYARRAVYQRVAEEHLIRIGIERGYVPENAAYQQLFPPYYLTSIKPPLFLLNAAYDTWQIRNVLQYPLPEWRPCVENITTCQPNQLAILQGFRESFFNSLDPAIFKRKDWGMFINSCFHHCQGGESTLKIQNMTRLEVLGNWMYERQAAQAIDYLPWPSNPTCVTYFELD